MPLTDAQTQSLVEHLATRVMGWEIYEHPDGSQIYVYSKVTPQDPPRIIRGENSEACAWNPTINGSDMMQVWEKADSMGIGVMLSNDKDGWHGRYAGFLSTHAASGPLALCLAVAKVTGWEGGREK